MTPERAQEIVTAINDRCMITMGMVPEHPLMPLQGISLAEMLEAKSRIEAENQTAVQRQRTEGGSCSIKVVPDDRLIAAAYALEHFQPSKEPILYLPVRDLRGTHAALAVVFMDADAQQDEDDGED